MSQSGLEPMKTIGENFGFSKSKGHALLLIDFQVEFLTDDGRMPVARNHVAQVLATSRLSMQLARSAGDPILAIGNEFKPGDHLMNLLRRGASIAGSSGSRWDDRLPLDQIDYLPKWAGSAFVNPEVENWLVRGKISSVTLTGLKARACIRATAKDAVKRGLGVRILADAVACDSDKSRASALARLQRMGIVIGSSATYLDWPREVRAGASAGVMGS